MKGALLMLTPIVPEAPEPLPATAHILNQPFYTDDSPWDGEAA